MCIAIGDTDRQHTETDYLRHEDSTAVGQDDAVGDPRLGWRRADRTETSES